MKVDCVIAGAQKSGTTTLQKFLSQHPSVHMASIKGTHFFDTEHHFSNAAVDYSAYHSFFSPQPHHRLIGEATPIYSFWEPAARRIWEYNPDMKVIVVLRNPIDRAYSHWNMERSRKREQLIFEEALMLEGERAHAALPLQDRHFSYVARGFYTEQLRRLARYFPSAQRLVLRMEDVLNPGTETADRIWNFLGLQSPGPLPLPHANQRHYTAPMAAATRRALVETFENEIRALERMLGWDLNSWLVERDEITEADRNRLEIKRPTSPL
jgi:hypothetical protein